MALALVRRLRVATPFIFLDRDELDRALDRFNRHLPQVRLFYAIKANPAPPVLAYFASHRVSFDVASPDEIRIIRDMGTLGGDIILSTPVKTAATVKAMIGNRVHAFAYDTVIELKRIAEAIEQSAGTEYPLALVRLKIESANFKIDLNQKFGCLPSEAPRLLHEAAQLGFSRLGICFHVGTHCWSAQSYLDAIRSALLVARKAKREFGVSCQVINIGGGFCDPESAAAHDVDLEQFYAAVGSACELAIDNGYRVYAEPGRCLVASAGTLVTTVIGKSVRDGQNWLYLDDGIYGCYSIKTYEQTQFTFSAIPMKPKMDRETMASYTVAGPSCDSLDVVAANVPLPEELSVDDLVLTPGLGAYTLSTASKFNGFALPKCIVVDSKIVARE
jgi:ornithine decarboxylase